MVFRPSAALDGQRESCAPLGCDWGIPASSGRDDSSDACGGSEGIGGALLRRILRIGMDRRNFVGRAAGYWRGLCGISCGGDEYVRKPGRCPFGDGGDVHGRALWMECAVPNCGGALRDRGSILAEDRLFEKDHGASRGDV